MGSLIRLSPASRTGHRWV